MNATEELPFIKLRAIEPEDLDMLYTVENDIEHWEIGTTNVPYSRYLLHDYIANASADIYADGQVRLIIEDENKQFVGMVDIVNFTPQHSRAEVSIIIIKERRRLGYATATIKHVKEYAHNVLHLHQLYAIVDKANTNSYRLFKKIGFNTSGELNDWLYDGTKYKDAVLLQCIL